LLVAFALIWFAHCSFSSAVEKTSRSIERTSKSVVRQVTFSGGPYRHQVAVGGFQTIPQDPQDKIKLHFEREVPAYLSKNCKGILMYAGGQQSAPSLLTDPPLLVNGEIDAYGLSFIGRQLGINAYIVGSLQSVRRVDELEGFLWNKETIQEVRIAVRFEVFQMLTATKILDSIYRRDVPIEELSFEQGVAPAEQELPDLDKALSDILDEAGADICDALLNERWNGFITSVEGEKIIVSAGSRAGLKPGAKLKVIDSTQTIEGVDGQRFFQMGDDVATIEVVSVTDDRSEARQIDGGQVKLGQSVRPAD
jgi:hypothetical protein